MGRTHRANFPFPFNKRNKGKVALFYFYFQKNVKKINNNKIIIKKSGRSYKALLSKLFFLFFFRKIKREKINRSSAPHH